MSLPSVSFFSTFTTPLVRAAVTALLCAVLLTFTPPQADAQDLNLPEEDQSGQTDQGPDVPQSILEELQPEEPRQPQPQDEEETEQPDRPPVWLVMERGKRRFHEGTYGAALRVFREVLERKPNNANAHLWVGHVFFTEGEYQAARKKYRDALEHQDTFYPYELRYEALYSLAEIERLQGNDTAFRETMRRIIQEGSRNPLSEQRRSAMDDTFLGQGLDKLLELYRVREKRVRSAYAALGLHALEQERYEEARKQLMLSVSISLSLAIDTVREESFDYAFIREELPVSGEQFIVRNTRRFLQNAKDRSYLVDYFSNIDFYRELFALGAALYGGGHADEAEKVWLITAEHREAGKWSALAREQLGAPDLQNIPELFVP